MIRNSLKILVALICACTLSSGSVFADELNQEEVSYGELNQETTTSDETLGESYSDNNEILEETTDNEEDNTLTKNDLETKDLGEIDLEYDDRYVFSESLADNGYANFEIAYIETEGEVESYKVSNGNVSSKKDENVLLKLETQKVVATGIGNATVVFSAKSDLETVEKLFNGETIDDYEGEIPETVSFEVEVSPATLTIMYLAGQSNMEGLCSSSTGCQTEYSVENEEGKVYSTYAPKNNAHGQNITGISDMIKGTSSNAKTLVAGALGYEGDNLSIAGNELVYPIYALTSLGNGKTGPDSALAYQWNKLTGEKVWTVNAAYSASSISSWKNKGTLYQRAMAYFNLANQTYNAEIESGHYVEGSKLMFWFQGEADRLMTASQYATGFLNIMSSFKSELSVEKIGVMTTRAAYGNQTGKIDVRLTAPRLVQYAVSTNPSYDYICMVFNTGDKWISDAAVKSSFSNAYPSGYLTYPTQSEKTIKIPVTEKEIHSDIHYSQIGHNQNGINAANNMYKALNDNQAATSAKWVNSVFSKVTKLGVYKGGKINVAAVVSPVYAKITVAQSNSHAVYNAKTGQITGKSKGTTTFTIISNGKTLATLKVVVSESKDLSKKFGKKTGLYKYYGTWYYLKKGKVDTSFEGLVKNNGKLYYVKEGTIYFDEAGVRTYKSKKYLLRNGTVYKDYSGFYQSSDIWYYVKKGVVKNTTSLIKGTVNDVKGYWHVVKGKVKFDTNVVKKGSTWYYVKNGKVDFTYTGPASNKKGWWYIENGKLNFNFTGFTATNTGKWYVENGKIDLSLRAIVKVGKNYWYIKYGKVADYTGRVRVGNTVYTVKDCKVTKIETE